MKATPGDQIDDAKLISIFIKVILFVTGSLYPVLVNGLLLGSFPWKDGLKLQFLKPWLITWGIFSGISICAIPLAVTTKCFKNEMTMTWHLFRACSLPAICMIVSTVFQIYSLIYLAPSVWKIAQFFGLIFSTLIAGGTDPTQSVLLEWTGLLIVFIGVIISGTSALFSDKYIEDNPSDTLFAIIFMMFSELVKAGQAKIEEIMLHEYCASSYVVVLCEGAWGWFLTTCICLPLLQISSPTSPILVYENTYDAFIMMSYSRKLIILFIFVSIIVGIYFYIGVIVISHMSARKRNEFEAISPIVVWIFSICAHYLTEDITIGETIQLYSIVQIIGFIISIIGIAIYDQKIKLPWMIYDDDKEQENSLSSDESDDDTATLKTL